MVSNIHTKFRENILTTLKVERNTLTHPHACTHAHTHRAWLCHKPILLGKDSRLTALVILHVALHGCETSSLALREQNIGTLSERK
jgi:hypothetical protein